MWKSFGTLLALTTACTVCTSVALADDRIELQSGDTLTGTIIERTDEHVIVDHAVLGRLTIPNDQIASLPELPEAEPSEPVVVEELPAATQAPWRSQIDVGLSGSRGNSESIDLRASFLTTQETDTHRWRIDAAYYYGENESETNKNQATAGVLRDWLFPDSPWLVFAQARYDYDDFRDWSHRLSGHAGVGYDFIKNDEFTLIGRLGAGAAKEWKRSSRLRPEGLIGAEFAWNISESQRLAAHTTVYPDLDDLGEYRIVSGVQWTLQMDVARGLALSAGIDNEYQSEVDSGVKKNDLKFYTGLTFQF